MAGRGACGKVPNVLQATYGSWAIGLMLLTLVAPSLLSIAGCGPLTAAKIVGETAQVRRFRSKDAFTRLNGTAPLPVWSSNKQRHRLSRTGIASSTPPCTASR
jgi:transposase